MPPLAILALGLACLLAGAEGLVRGAARLARAAGISPLVVGLVIVSIGTSAPEIAVTVGAARTGASDLAVGNVVGSNIFNVLFILGLSALVVPLVVQRRLVRVDIPIMVAASLLLAILALDQRIGLFDAVLMLALAAGYILLNLRLGRREAQAADAADPQPPVRGRLWRSALLALAGLALLVLGARLAVDGASDLARGFGVSELVIGLTIVAAGTSLPEVATSVLAAARGERDIAVGNVVGSNVLNILLILGIAGVAAPSGLVFAPGVLSFDLPVMVAACIAVLPVASTRQTIARWEGALFLGYYVAYVGYLVLDATEHPASDGYAAAFTYFVLPLTALVLGAALGRELRRRGGRRRTAEARA